MVLVKRHTSRTPVRDAASQQRALMDRVVIPRRETQVPKVWLLLSEARKALPSFAFSVSEAGFRGLITLVTKSRVTTFLQMKNGARDRTPSGKVPADYRLSIGTYFEG